jgi:hypothetical protein
MHEALGYGAARPHGRLLPADFSPMTLGNMRAKSFIGAVGVYAAQSRVRLLLAAYASDPQISLARHRCERVFRSPPS